MSRKKEGIVTGEVLGTSERKKGRPPFTKKRGKKERKKGSAREQGERNKKTGLNIRGGLMGRRKEGGR